MGRWGSSPGEAGDGGGELSDPSTWTKAAQSAGEAGDAALRFFLALVITGEMTGLLLAGVAAQTAAGMGAGDAVAAGSAAEAFPTSATVAAVASVAARLRSRHLFLRAALLALWALR